MIDRTRFDWVDPEPDRYRTRHPLPVSDESVNHTGRLPANPPPVFLRARRTTPPPAWGGGRPGTPLSLISGFKKFPGISSISIVKFSSRIYRGHGCAQARGVGRQPPLPFILDTWEPPLVVACSGAGPGSNLVGGPGTGAVPAPSSIAGTGGTEQRRY
jgi:hypothetical protein